MQMRKSCSGISLKKKTRKLSTGGVQYSKVIFRVITPRGGKVCEISEGMYVYTVVSEDFSGRKKFGTPVIFLDIIKLVCRQESTYSKTRPVGKSVGKNDDGGVRKRYNDNGRSRILS